MIDFTNSNITKLIVHQIGNKFEDEGVILSTELIKLAEASALRELLIRYCLFPFLGKEELFSFTFHDGNFKLNSLYQYSKEVFENQGTFANISYSIAKQLYNVSNHPKIKSGDLFIAYFEGLLLNNEKTNAIGIFKSENNQNYIKVNKQNKGISLLADKGININKLDKGCLIFETHNDSGFRISIIDNISKGNEAQYWKDDFLKVKTLNNAFHQTNEFLGITKEFIINQLSDEIKLSKTDKIDFLNRSVNYFKENTAFDKSDFEEKVFEDAGIIDSFRNYENNFQEENEVVFEDNFEISTQAVKKQARKFKSVLKLDKNFHIYIHGDRDLIEQGIDEKGRKFYKIYYEEEN